MLSLELLSMACQYHSHLICTEKWN